MLAWVGFAAQALVTGRSPLQDWDVFLSDPEKNNLLAAYIGDLRDYPKYVELKAEAQQVYSDVVARIVTSQEYKDIVAQGTALVGQVASSPEFQSLQKEAVEAAFQAQVSIARLLEQVPLQQ